MTAGSVKATSEAPPSGLGISRRDFASVAAAAVATAAAATLPGILPTPASAQSTGVGTSSSLVRLDKRTPQLWQVTIANPPFNLVVPEIVSALHSIVQDMDHDPEVRVIVFTSEIEGYFFNHFDLSRAQDFPIEATDPPLPTWSDLVLRLSKSPVISIGCCPAGWCRFWLRWSPALFR